MNRRCISGIFSVVCMSLVFAGCQKPADQQPAAGSTGTASSTDNSRTAKNERPVAPAPKPVVVPAETPVHVVLDQTISSKTSTSGQTFSATVAAPIEVDGKVVVPKGARAEGIVREAKPAGRFKGAAVLSLTLTRVEVGGKSYEIHTSSPTRTSVGKGKRTAVMVGGGAGGGALIGGLAGGGKGALIGGLIGAGAGAGGAAFTGKRDITLPAETALTFRLREPLEVTLR